MPQMNRNINLEEIDSDALFGIDALKNQTFFQKVVFFGLLGVGVTLNVALPLLFEVPSIVCILILLVLLGVAVAFGCNYEEDMTYGKYLYLYFFKPTKTIFFRSTEDKESRSKRAEEIKKEEDRKLMEANRAKPEEQRKLLMKLVAFVLVMVIAICGVFIYAGTKDDTHHTIEMTE